MRRVKPTMDVYRVFRTALGWCAAARSGAGICAFVLPVPDADAAETEIRLRCEDARKSKSALRGLVKVVDRYFNGWRTDFDEFPLDLSGGTPFQRKVWTTTRVIPYGEVRTYRWIGMEMGRPRAMRAIGAALGANPAPLLVPCHRVVAADGLLCGFSARGGVDLKAKMLELERVPMTGQGDARRVIAAW